MAPYRLSDRERAILHRQLNGLENKAKKRKHVFAYATLADKAILSASAVCALIAGALNPLVPVGDAIKQHAGP